MQLNGKFNHKAFRVSVCGYGNAIYYARSRGKALADAWHSDAFNAITFGQFLKIARACGEVPHERFGEAITVGGQPAFLVSWDQKYIQFARPDSDAILNAHPMDVEPAEARRGTPYYSPEAA